MRASAPCFCRKRPSSRNRAGRVGWCQPAGSLLFNGLSTAVRFREKLLDTYKVNEIVTSPPCDSCFFLAQSQSDFAGLHRDPQPSKPDGAPIKYISPKAQCTTEDSYRIVVEPQDVHSVAIAEGHRRNDGVDGAHVGRSARFSLGAKIGDV